MRWPTVYTDIKQHDTRPNLGAPRVERYQSESGAWYEIEDCDGVPSRCRLTGPDDQSTHEHHEYDMRCAPCWLGYGHSADYHARELAERRIRSLAVQR